LKANLEGKERAIKYAARVLKTEGGSPEALQILSGEIVDKDADVTINELVDQLKAARTERDEALAEGTDLKERLETQGREIEQGERERTELQNELETRTNTLETLRRQIAQLTKEKQRLEETNEELKNANTEQSERLRAIGVEHQTQLAEVQQRHQREVEEIREELARSEQRFTEESKQLKKHAKARLRARQTKIGLESQRAAKLQDDLEDIASQLKREEAAGQSAQKEIQRLETVVSELKTELSTAQINNRMTALKLQNTEEQLKRERARIETRAQLSDMGIESAHQAALQQQKNDFDTKYRALLESIAERLSYVAEIGQPVSEESVLEGIAKVASLVPTDKQGATDGDSARAEIAAVRRLLAVADDAPIEPEVRDLLKKVRLGWEEWAQRMHALVTNSFSLVKTSEELQFALEEALLASVHQNQIVRKLEMLRLEKRILVARKLPLHRSQRKVQPSFLAVLSAIAALRKLQKLAGSMDGGTRHIEHDSL
jgi:myosin heavy subunit